MSISTTGFNLHFPYVSFSHTAKVIVNGIERGQQQMGETIWGNPGSNIFYTSQITNITFPVTQEQINAIPAYIIFENAEGAYDNDAGSYVTYSCP